MDAADFAIAPLIEPRVQEGSQDRTMVLNMGPQHPSTHGVLRLVLEIDGETVLRLVPDIGFLHTGIEKPARPSSTSRWCRSPIASIT